MHAGSAALPPAARLRVLFFGMLGAFSPPPLAALLDASGVEVCAALVPAAGDPAQGIVAPPVRHLPPRAVPRSTLPVLTPFPEPSERSIVALAWECGVPVLEVARAGHPDEIAAALAAYAPDVACVACWPWRLPEVLLALPPHGVLNLHPSLLPAHRGPAPLFWTLRAGERRTGVTVHAMEARLDAGAILAQEALEVPGGIDGGALERRCAALGGRLLVAALAALAAGTVVRQAQDPNAGSYEPWPTPEDFVVTGDRSARWAFDFIRGAPQWGGPVLLQLGARRLVVEAALDYDAAGTLGAAYWQAGSELWLQCAPGVLHVRIG